MLSSIYTHVLFPLFSRLGTGAAVLLAGAGANGTQAEQVGYGITAALMIGVDLGASYLRRKKLEADAARTGKVK